jgi:hypothetical protein
VCVPDTLICEMFGCFVLSAVTIFSACLRRQVVYFGYVAVCCLCVCVPDVLVCGMLGCFTIKHLTDKYIRHAHT